MSGQTYSVWEMYGREDRWCVMDTAKRTVMTAWKTQQSAQAECDRMNAKDFERTADAFVNRHVYANASAMVNTLVCNYEADAMGADSAEELLTLTCLPEPEDDDEDPVEIYEHWIISDWLAEKLSERGEMVANPWSDGVWLWGRTCTGQAISLDGVIRELAREFPHA